MVEDTLGETNRLLETILNHTPILIAYLDPQFNFIKVNRAYAEADEREPSFFPGKNHFNLYPNEEIEMIFRRVVKTGEPHYAYATPFQHAESPELRVSYWDWSLIPVKNPAGNINGLVLTLADVTERKRAENALKESEERYRRVIENSPAAVWSFSNVRGTLFVSSRVGSILGYSPDLLYERPWLWSQSIHPDDRHRVAQAIKDFAAGEELEVEYRILDSSGHWRWLRDRSVGRYAEGGEIIIEGFSIDITDRKRTEEELGQRKEQLQVILDNIPVMISYFNPEGKLIYANKTMEHITGWTFEELQGRDSISDFYPDEEYRRGVMSFIHRGEGVWGEFKTRIRDGRVLDTAWANVRLSDGSIIGIGQDISRRKRVERERESLFRQVEVSREQLVSLSRRLVEVQEAERRDLAGRLHDDVGQDLTALSLNLNIVRDMVRGKLPAAVRAALATRMDDSVNLVDKTVDHIRDVMAELRPPMLDDYGLTAALHWYGKEFSERTGIATGLQLDELTPRLPLSWETTLFRISQEALTNVAKHAHAKTVTVMLEELEDSIRLTVTDDGIGFDPQNHRAPGAKPSWGLINMRERAQAIGGQLSLETHMGKGTWITVEVQRPLGNQQG